MNDLKYLRPEEYQITEDAIHEIFQNNYCYNQLLDELMELYLEEFENDKDLAAEKLSTRMQELLKGMSPDPEDWEYEELQSIKWGHVADTIFQELAEAYLKDYLEYYLK